MTDNEALEAMFTFNHLLEGGDLDEKVTCGDVVRATRIAINAIRKQLVISPVPDENATDRFGKPVPRCQVCGYALDLQIEQYCPCCGQRLTEYSESEVNNET